MVVMRAKDVHNNSLQNTRQARTTHTLALETRISNNLTGTFLPNQLELNTGMHKTECVLRAHQQRAQLLRCCAAPQTMLCKTP